MYLCTYQLNHFWNRPTTFDRLDHNQTAGYHDLPYDTCCWDESKCTKKKTTSLSLVAENQWLCVGRLKMMYVHDVLLLPNTIEIQLLSLENNTYGTVGTKTSSKYYREVWNTDKWNSRGPMQIDSSQAPARNGYLGPSASTATFPYPTLKYKSGNRERNLIGYTQWIEVYTSAYCATMFRNCRLLPIDTQYRYQRAVQTPFVQWHFLYCNPTHRLIQITYDPDMYGCPQPNLTWLL